MKALFLALTLSIIINNVHAAKECLNLSGTFEFKGFDGHECSLNNNTRRLEPLPLGDVIKPYSLVTIKQTACDSLELIFSDDRFLNTKGIRKTHILSDKSIEIQEGMLKFSNSNKDSYCGMGGCLSSIYTKSWSLGLDKDNNLKMSYRYKSAGLLNYIIPVVSHVKADCTLHRVP